MNQQDNQPLTQIKYDGKVSQLYKIAILDNLLNIITLGLYYYWGKTRKRRYLTASFSLLGDRFEYTGSGDELLFGVIKAVLILMALTIPLFISAYIMHPYFTAGFLIFYFLYLPFIAVYGSLRYHASRIRWRGIRGHVTGSSLVYGLIGPLHLFLKIITLGLWISFADLMTYKYRIQRLSFGNQAASFKPAYGKLFASNLKTGLLVLVTAVPLLFLAWYLIHYNQTVLDVIKEAPQTDPTTHYKTSTQIALFRCLSIISSLSGLAIFSIIRCWYKAALIRAKYQGLSFGNIGFSCTVTASNLLHLKFLNALIIIFTLGLGLPWTTHRRMQYFCKHIGIQGDLANSSLLQAKGNPDIDYEGLSTLFDIKIELF